MVAEKEDRATFSSGRLDDRVLTTLKGLPGRVAFSGLKRVLHAHPESLARALRRLEREGLVERVDGGYRALSGPTGTSTSLTRELRPIAEVDLPLYTPPEALLARLAGRWFGSLRWVGVVNRPDERFLAWARREGSDYVLLGLYRGKLRVYVPADPATDSGEADDSAYELLVHAVDALRPVPTTSASVTFLSARTPDPPNWTRDN
jgi:hypothetical protein